MLNLATPVHPKSMQPKLQRGLNREEAAKYFGVSTTFFDTCVANEKLPPPMKLGNRSIWDLFDLDRAFDKLKREQGISLDMADELDPWAGVTDVSGRTKPQADL